MSDGVLKVLSCWVLSVGALLIMPACSTPQHTNALMFGTNTKFALDVSVDPTSGQPGITVGYKRQEAVWLPLLANAEKDGKPATCPNGATADCPYLFAGKDDKLTDTYSVLASFGTTYSGEATGATPGVKAGGALAQYFATGLAARKLAEAGGAKLVSIQPEDTVSEEIKKAAAAQISQGDYKAGLITAYVQENGKVNGDRLKALAKDTGLEASFQKYAGEDINKFRDDLKTRYSGNIDALAKNIK